MSNFMAQLLMVLESINWKGKTSQTDTQTEGQTAGWYDDNILPLYIGWEDKRLAFAYR